MYHLSKAALPMTMIPRLTRNAVANTSRYSPHDILSQFDDGLLTIKRSLKQHRFFMYEEHDTKKLQDDNITPTIMAPPIELATLLQSNRRKSEHHYYWTSPISSVAGSLSKEEFQWHKQLYNKINNNSDGDYALLDPRGPSLWMGTSGSGTQCHYDVANNIVVQLYGTKRIRCYAPIAGVYNLHVYPDAHAKARKSQVDFDYNMGSDSGGDDASMMQKRYPHYYSNIPKPVLDVTLHPGDSLEIPAFYFHHVENGHSATEEGDDIPSVSLNIFALSKQMMIAQQIFQKASRPMGRVSTKDDISLCMLKALGTTLLRGLNIVDASEETEFIRKYLLRARYTPLDSNKGKGIMLTRDAYNSNKTTLTDEQTQTINACIERILPDFELLIEDREKGNNEDDGNSSKGIVLLVALHLMELWAVELVGSSNVANAWDEALSA